MGKRILKTGCYIVGFALLLFLGTCAYAKVQAYRARVDAQSLLADLKNIRVGGTVLADVQAVVSRHSRYRGSFLNPPPPECANDDMTCGYDFKYDNLLLARLSSTSVVRFGVRIQVNRGRVDAIMIDLLEGVAPHLRGATIIESIQPFSGHTVEVPHMTNQPALISVRLIPGAPERDQFFSLRLDCLDHIGECDSGLRLPDR